MTDLFDGMEAKGARDEALARVRSNAGDWGEKALVALGLIRGFEGTAEDIRIRLKMLGLVDPHHYNAWGAFAKDAIKAGRYVPTGKMRHMKTTKSHARRTPVYVVR